NIEYIIRKGVVMALTAIVLTIAGMTESYCGSRFAAGYVKNIREKLFQKIQSLSLESVGKFGTASLMTRLTVDMNAIKKAIGMLASLIKCPMLIIFATYMTSRINMSLSWIFLAVLPVFAIVLFILNKLARKHYRAMFIQYDKMNNILDENVSGIKTVKAYV
ncbi:MAG: ABC transporter transmembrane domain-containing protein, partial [Lachnospiraceae bacterium]|nr:ABC transporter transmembrane domain-containing protein [Lachnospiraceae bacterium]